MQEKPPKSKLLNHYFTNTQTCFVKNRKTRSWRGSEPGSDVGVENSCRIYLTFSAAGEWKPSVSSDLVINGTVGHTAFELELEQSAATHQSLTHTHTQAD